ncbi:MAG: hypothetical protein JSU89_15740 [Myxococcales bacterium]|nr:MAG: hypothetical protein JSU89_15740 [Myxococcales bacterium]
MKVAAMILGMLAAAVVGCGCNGVTYEIDGVTVVLEKGDGPEREHMLLASEKYRTEAGLRWDLMPDDETAVWRALSEIRWTAEGVPDRAAYDPATRAIRATWLGCALSVPLYSELTEHYVAVLQEGSGPTDDDRQWARDLESATAVALCRLDF